MLFVKTTVPMADESHFVLCFVLIVYIPVFRSSVRNYVCLGAQSGLGHSTCHISAPASDAFPTEPDSLWCVCVLIVGKCDDT